MESAPVLRFTLLDRCHLYVEYHTSFRVLSVCCLPLDTRLGNQEGQFRIGGHNLSLSARGITLRGNILHARLRSSSGNWWHDQLAIDVNTVDLSINFRRCDYFRLEGCDNIRLIDQTLLVTEYIEPSANAKDLYFDMSQFIGIKNGAFDRHGRSFLDHVQNAQITGTTLYATHTETKRQISIGVCSILRVRDGKLLPLREAKDEDLDHEVLMDVSNKTWLRNANYIRLVNYKQKRTWYLIANCLSSRGTFQESAIKLHKIIGPHDDEMFSFFSEISIPEYARKTIFENGTLTASFEASDGKWIQRSFDLAELVTNEGGVLVKRRSGSECSRCSSLFYCGAFHFPPSISSVLVSGPKLSTTRHCTFCNLIDKAIKEYTPVCDSYETWITTRNHWENVNIFTEVRAIGHKDVTLTIRAYGIKSSTRRALYDWIIHRKQIGEDKGRQETETSEFLAPRRYRTIPRNLYDRCWLHPDLRWATIRSWITLCQSEHGICSNPISPQLPSRYLDLGVSELGPIRLVISNGEQGQYACLSHCWGDAQVCTLTSETKSEYTTEIRKSVLTPVFFEAIEVCRKLGLRRLWIDSLCIQQDSKEDWQYESQRMGSYYLNCTICIAATSSASSFKSFDIAERPKVVSTSGMDPESGAFSLLAYPFELMDKCPHFGSSDDLEIVLQSFPLLTRGWVLQERSLSPRVLHFCGSEVVFECAEMTTCECGRARRSFMEQNIKLSNTRATTRALDGLIAQRKQLEVMIWTTLITTYSSLKFTYNSDRLVAISGLASAFHDRRRQRYEEGELGALPQYLAGIWSSNLIQEMSWFVGSPLIFAKEEDLNTEAEASAMVRRSKPTVYIAPSWSWASILDSIRYLLMGNLEPLFTLLNVQIHLATENPFGAVKEGCSLYLRGKVLKSAWALQTGFHNKSVYRLKDITGAQLVGKTDRIGIDFSPDYAIAKPGPDQLNPETILYVLPLARVDMQFTVTTQEVDEDIVKESRVTLCLVLKMVERHSEGPHVYERIGFTEYTNYQNGVRNIDPNEYVEEEFYII